MLKPYQLSLISLLVVTSTVSLSVAAGERVWKDRTGNFSIKAELVGVSIDSVQLRRHDGQVITVPIKKLSEPDRRYLKALSAKKPSPVPLAEDFEIVLVRDGKPVHKLICLPNDQAEPSAVLALKEYRALVAKATGTEPVRNALPSTAA